MMFAHAKLFKRRIFLTKQNVRTTNAIAEIISPALPRSLGLAANKIPENSEIVFHMLCTAIFNREFRILSFKSEIIPGLIRTSDTRFHSVQFIPCAGFEMLCDL